MKIIFKSDPRRMLHIHCWAVAATVYNSNEEEETILVNFLSSFLNKKGPAPLSQTEIGNSFFFTKVEGSTNMGVSYPHAQTLLNFCDAMGWEYTWKAQYAQANP